MQEKQQQKGFLLPTMAPALVLVLAFAALGVDVGVLYSARTAAQRAADAAALAGAFSFVVNPSSPQPDTAYDHAMSTALSNNILGTPVTEPRVSVAVETDSRQVIVEISHVQETFLGV